MHIVDEVPELDGRRPAADGGRRSTGSSTPAAPRARAAQHLVDLAEARVVATFDVDQFHDYRARRPPMSFVRDHYEAYDAPRLVVRLVHDTGGTPYLLLHGPEPDNRWEAFAARCAQVVERFGVTRVVSHGVGADGGAAHAADRDHPPRQQRRAAHRRESVARRAADPVVAQALLELRLGEWGHDAMGFVAHIPHYLAQLDYPAASIALLEQVERAAWLTVDLTGLRAEAEDREAEIARYLSANEEVGDVVTALEQQYDAFARAESAGSSLLAADQPLPTGEEIGQQFEQFLAGLDGPDRDPTGRAGGDPVTVSAAALVELLDLERIDVNLFRGRQPDTDRQRVFGGQVAAQALVAGIRTVDPEFGVHSLHSYFLLPGDTAVPIVYDVEQLRDGRSFATRRVVARQHGRPIYFQTASFQRAEEGSSTRTGCPRCPSRSRASTWST